MDLPFVDELEEEPVTVHAWESDVKSDLAPRSLGSPAGAYRVDAQVDEISLAQYH